MTRRTSKAPSLASGRLACSIPHLHNETLSPIYQRELDDVRGQLRGWAYSLLCDRELCQGRRPSCCFCGPRTSRAGRTAGRCHHWGQAGPVSPSNSVLNQYSTPDLARSERRSAVTPPNRLGFGPHLAWTSQMSSLRLLSPLMVLAFPLSRIEGHCK